MDPVVRAVAEFETKTTDFRTSVNPEVMTAKIATAIEAFKHKFSADAPGGLINMATPETLKKFTNQAQAQYVDGRAAEAKALQAEMTATEVALAATMAAVSELPDPLRVEDRTSNGDHGHELRRVGLLLEREREERRLSGKTRAQVAAIYEAADDRRDAVLKFTVEDQQRRGWADITLAQDGDIAGTQRLTKAIASAQRARLEKHAPQLLDAERRLKALTGSAVLSQLFAHLASGRGLQLVRTA